MTRQRGKSTPSKRPRSKPAFYLDENVSRSFGQTLRSLGSNVAFAGDRPGLTDLAQLRRAIQEDRVFVTHDRDFLSQKVIKDRIPQSPGVVFLSTDNPSDQNYDRLARQVLQFLARQRVAGKICLVSVGSSRLAEE